MGPLAVFSELGITHSITLHHFHEHGVLFGDGIVKLVEMQLSCGGELGQSSSGRLLRIPDQSQHGYNPRHIGINRSKPRDNAFLNNPVYTPRVNSIRVEELHIVVEILPFRSKIRNHLVKLLACSVRLPRTFSQKRPNLLRRGTRCCGLRELNIQQGLETPGRGNFTRAMGLTVLVTPRLGIQLPPHSQHHRLVLHFQ